MSEHIIELEAHTCGNCGVTFGFERSHLRALRESKKGWYCVNGCSRVFTGKSEAEKERERTAQAEASAKYWRDQTEVQRLATKSAERRTLAYQGHLGKLKKRIANGVCPCCKRTFGNVARHIASQHPDYSAPEFVMPRADETPEPVKAKRGAKVVA